MLAVESIETFYGVSQALFGVSLEVREGQVVALLGRNGMGKTTTVSSVMGLNPPRAGTVQFKDQPIHGQPSHAIARAGLALVPEGRRIFPNLTLRENLVATAANRRGVGSPWTVERIFAMFPSLAERADNMGNALSGGEQQMLAIGRALLTNPELLILDEATEGLAPMIRDDIWRCLAGLKEEGLAILVIDKNLDALMRLADWHYIMEKGRIVWSGDSTALAAAPELRARYLGV
ncbi:MAG: ATP-binding cassette domain-containing protein [Alphaproteobacteria bacterium]|nr:ATP-binding cassette domain-containing protein [Alphaproteobacteria bacterium]